MDIARQGRVRWSVREAGELTQPAVLLLHGQPTSSHTFRNLIPLLADTAHVVAPDLPGFGFSDAPPQDRYEYTFQNIADTIEAKVDELGLERWFLYVHDYPAAVAYHLATRRPERVLGLIVQNGSAHDDGMHEIWDTALRLGAHEPACLMLWGRHDPFYQLDEIMAYARELERVEIHVFDGAHLLLETHYRECAEVIRSFVAHVATQASEPRSGSTEGTPGRRSAPSPR